jgi:hypothetical protein
VGIVCSSRIAGELSNNGRGKFVYDDHARLVSHSIEVREVRVSLDHFPGNQPDGTIAQSNP